MLWGNEIVQLENIPKKEQKDVLSSFWFMLRTCESMADCNDDRLLKRDVEGFYRQWNRITGANYNPIWIERKKIMMS